jgi:hypothetical protein
VTPSAPPRVPAQAPFAAASPTPKRPWYQRPVWWVVGGIVLVVVIAAAAGGGGSSKKSSSNASTPSSGSSSASKPSGNPNRPNEATDSNTPHVGPNQAVTVDALVYRVASAKTAKTVGDAATGLGATANGTFVIVGLNIHSDKHDTVTLTSDSTKLTDGKNDYSVSTDATTSLLGTGAKPIFLQQVDAQSDVKGTVVFDVPTVALARKLEMKFTELGFGSTKGFIALPPLGQ